MSRKDAIEKALGSVYARNGKTKGTMIESCAKHLDDSWERMEKQADRSAGQGSERDMHYEVHMQIWNWFPGGGTAEIAADRVMEAVNEGDD